MSSSSRQLTVSLRDGSQVILRPIEAADKRLLLDAFERLSADSRYRRFFTGVQELRPSDLVHLTEVDHRDHEAIIAVDASTGRALGVARYVRAERDPETAEAAIVVVDDFHGRGLGRALLERLANRARREGVRRFSALIQADNVGVARLLEDLGSSKRVRDGAEVQVLIELPKRGIGARLARALRAAAEGSFVAADTLAGRVAVNTREQAKPLPAMSGQGIRAIVVGTDGSPASEDALRAAVELAGRLEADLHLVCAYRLPGRRADAEAVLARGQRNARAAGQRTSTHARREHPAEALLAAAEEHDADVIVVGSRGMTATGRFLLGSVADQIAHHAPCHVLIVRPA